MNIVTLLSLSIIVLVSGDSDLGLPREVRITQGNIRGYKKSGSNYFSFHGIPYATAPTGPNKFKSPLPAPSWDDTLEATNKNILCPQTYIIQGLLKLKNESFLEQEDCLIANIFVPDTENENLPVVVYIHGGAFQIGFGNMFIHDPLLKSGKIIEVNFNYRLGVHGFLCLGTEDVPGNAGIKDQVAALKWVKENIDKFGGNPNDVTVAGFSAGSSSAELLMISDSARGLFNKVILESGSAIGVWSTQDEPVTIAKNYAAINNYRGKDDIFELEEFYKTMPLSILQIPSFLDRKDSTFAFVPCVEKVVNDDAIISVNPINIIKSGKYNKVPVLVGFGNMEGMFRLPLFENWKGDMNSNFAAFLPADLSFKSKDERKEVAGKIKEFYFGYKDIDIYTIINFVEYFSDVLFAYSGLLSVKLQVDAGSDSIYLYQYSFADESTITENTYSLLGATHCAQSMTISKSIYVGESAKISETYQDVKDMLVNLWLNFIINGKPVPEKSERFPSGWPAVSRENHYYMELNEKPDLRTDLLKDRVNFWNSIYERYRKVPQPPQTVPSRSEL